MSLFEEGEGVFVAPSSTHAVLVPLPPRTTSGAHAVVVRCVRDLSPLDMIDLANGVADATGHKVWSGAELFVAFLARSTGLRRWCSSEGSGRRSAVELGCGTGLSGLALAASTDLRLVLLTDGHEGVVEFATGNAALNATLGRTAVQVRRLEWNDRAAIDAARAEAQRIDVSRGDAGEAGFDLVIATDVIYDEDVVEAMVHAAAALVGLPSTSSGAGEREGSSHPVERRLIVAHVPRCANDAAVRRRLAAACQSCGFKDGAWLSAAQLDAAPSVLESTSREEANCGPAGEEGSGSLRRLAEVGAAVFVASTHLPGRQLENEMMCL